MRPAHRVQIGDTGPTRLIGPITQTDIVRFAGAGGDFNPLHHDPAFAAAGGFPGVIAMGQLPAGMLAGWVTDWFGVENLRLFEVRFAAAVFVGDELEMTGRVTAVEPQDAACLAEVDLAVNRNGAAVVTGRATVQIAG